MKKQMILAMMASVAILAACSDDDNGSGNPGPGPAPSGVYETGLVFGEKEGSDSVYYIGNGDKHFPAPKGDYVLNASRKYKLRGWVYIEDGSTITIPAGTVIRGDKQTQAALIIERGGQIFARGTASKPIVFTSEEAPGNRRPGDWGGLILCGRASNNKGEQQIEGGPRSYHGGGSNPVDTDNSGVLSYVRVEFAGFPFQTDKEINGITFGSVGSGTTVDHLQVSYSNDDSFEWFGGSVGCKYLVAYHGWDDDFDTDNGFSGNLQFLLGVRDPRIADKSLSNGFESDNNSDGSDEEPYTTARFCNVTLIGPMGQDAAFYNQSASTENPGAYINAGEMFPNNGSGLGQFQAGVQIRRNSRISLYNSIVTGWPVALMIEKDKGDSPAAATAGLFEISNVHFSGYDKALESFDNTAIDPVVRPKQDMAQGERLHGRHLAPGKLCQQVLRRDRRRGTGATRQHALGLRSPARHRQRCRERFVHGSFRLRRLGQRFRRRFRNRRELDGRMDQLRSAEHGILIAPSAARRPLIGKPHSGHRPLCGLPFRRESGKRPNVSVPDAEVRSDSQDINSESLCPVTTATSRRDTRSPVPLEVPELG